MYNVHGFWRKPNGNQRMKLNLRKRATWFLKLKDRTASLPEEWEVIGSSTHR